MIKKIAFALILTVFLISCVSANELNDTLVSDFSNSSEISVSENHALSLNDNRQVLNSTPGSFDELSQKINNVPSGGLLVLDRDYQYLGGSNKGIMISKPITIDGAGHTLNGNKQSRIFNITFAGVTLKNINFINGNAIGRYGAKVVGGGAIYWSGANGLVENCRFTDNTGYGIEEDDNFIRPLPMGAKVNEGGAIVWAGDNGCVSRCTFVHNMVGYPNTGGAVCWKGDNGKIIDSEFYGNDAWCGSAIAWVGDYGEILRSTVVSSSYFDGGIYWFGKKGTIKDSMLISCNSNRSPLRPLNADVTANFNFWGDTMENPNKVTKIKSVKNWLVMRFTHNGEFVKKGQQVVIDYDILILTDKNGNMVSYDALSDKSGQLTYTAPKNGFLLITFKNGKVSVEVDSKDKISCRNLVKYYGAKISYKVKVSNIDGLVVGKYVKFTINKKTYKVKTNKKGVATLKLKLKPGKYTMVISYGKAKVKKKITIKTTLITKNVSKKVWRSAKFKIKVLNLKGKANKKQNVKVKFKGKTYKLKTNKKGIVIFKIPRYLKVGKYKIKTLYNGLTNKNKITVKR